MWLTLGLSSAQSLRAERALLAWLHAWINQIALLSTPTPAAVFVCYSTPILHEESPLPKCRQRDELGFDYFFESHDGIQATPFIYFENGKPVSDLNKNDKKWSWKKATAQPRYALVYDSDSDWLPSFEGPDGAQSELTCKSGGVSVRCTSTEGKFHFHRYGYDGFSTTHTGEVYVQAALNFIDKHKRKRFFLQFASQGVHTPHTPPTRFFGDRVRGMQLTKHLDMVREVDLQLKKLTDSLERHGLTPNTLVILTSDNGGLSKSIQDPGGAKTGHLASGTLTDYKGSDWEGGHRVPFFVRWPGVTPAGVTCDHPMVQTDLFATFAELTGQSKHEDSTKQGLDSTSMFSYFFDTEAACGLKGDRREALLVQQTKDVQTMVAVSQGHLKVVAKRTSKRKPYEISETTFRYVDLDAIETSGVSEKAASTEVTLNSASAGAAMLYKELASKMSLVAKGKRTTPPLARYSNRNRETCSGNLFETKKECKRSCNGKSSPCKKDQGFDKACKKACKRACKKPCGL